MKHPILLLILTNFREFVRQPGAVFWAVFFPVLMAGGLGLAFTQKGELHQKIAFVGNGQTEETSWSKKVGNETTGYTNYEFLKVGYDDALTLLKRGTVDIIITEVGGKYRYHYDPLNPEAQLAYLHLRAVLNGTANPTWGRGCGAAQGGRQPVHRLPGARPYGHGGHDVVHVGDQLRAD